jgi:hypothetical protein
VPIGVGFRTYAPPALLWSPSGMSCGDPAAPAPGLRGSIVDRFARLGGVDHETYPLGEGVYPRFAMFRGVVDALVSSRRAVRASRRREKTRVRAARNLGIGRRDGGVAPGHVGRGTRTACSGRENDQATRRAQHGRDRGRRQHGVSDEPDRGGCGRSTTPRTERRRRSLRRAACASRPTWIRSKATCRQRDEHALRPLRTRLRSVGVSA